MQLRKVCNHPDIFESRDYATPTRQLFNIFLVVPSAVLSIFTKDPMKSINYKNLFFLFEEFEKLSKLDYQNLVRNFPTRHFAKIYKQIIKNKQILWTPNYMIGDGEVLFKRDYADSTILYDSNTADIRQYGEEAKQNPNLQNYICATNIPLLQNFSASHYLDIINSSYNDSKDYLNSVFKDNITRIKNKKEKTKLETMYSNDLLSRKNIIYKKPIYGTDLLKLIKLNLLGNDFHFSKNIVYGNQYRRATMKNQVCNSIFNKVCNSEEEVKEGVYFNNINYEGVYENIETDVEQNEQNDHLILDEKEVYKDKEGLVNQDSTQEKDIQIDLVAVKENHQIDHNEVSNGVNVNQTNGILVHSLKHVTGTGNSITEKLHLHENGEIAKPINQTQTTDMDIEVEASPDSPSKKVKFDSDNKQAPSQVHKHENGNEPHDINHAPVQVQPIPTPGPDPNELSKKTKSILKASHYTKKKLEDKVAADSAAEVIFNKKTTAPFIHETKREFKESSMNPSETVHFLNSDNFKNLIYTPQKFLNICEDLMQNFRIHIPSVISSGPSMVPSSYNTDYYVSNKKFKYFS
jgi:hypothetical protein